MMLKMLSELTEHLVTLSTNLLKCLDNLLVAKDTYLYRKQLKMGSGVRGDRVGVRAVGSQAGMGWLGEK